MRDVGSNDSHPPRQSPKPNSGAPLVLNSGAKRSARASANSKGRVDVTYSSHAKRNKGAGLSAIKDEADEAGANSDEGEASTPAVARGPIPSSGPVDKDNDDDMEVDEVPAPAKSQSTLSDLAGLASKLVHDKNVGNEPEIDKASDSDEQPNNEEDGTEPVIGGAPHTTDPAKVVQRIGEDEGEQADAPEEHGTGTAETTRTSSSSQGGLNTAAPTVGGSTNGAGGVGKSQIQGKSQSQSQDPSQNNNDDDEGEAEGEGEPGDDDYQDPDENEGEGEGEGGGEDEGEGGDEEGDGDGENDGDGDGNEGPRKSASKRRTGSKKSKKSKKGGASNKKKSGAKANGKSSAAAAAAAAAAANPDAAYDPGFENEDLDDPDIDDTGEAEIEGEGEDADLDAIEGEVEAENENEQEIEQEIENELENDPENEIENEGELGSGVEDDDLEAEMDVDSDLQPAHRAEALDQLARLELKYALLREGIYVEKMEELAWEEALINEGLCFFFLDDF